MKRILSVIAFSFAPALVQGQSITSLLEGHVFPRFEALQLTTQTLSQIATVDCDPGSEALRTAYGTAFDAWIAASHLRFGPTEVDDRAFALAFWPDSRGATPRTLTTLITNEDPVARSAETYADVSIAARGFYAMEFLLYDDTISTLGDPDYHCTLVQTVAEDVAAMSTYILQDWTVRYAEEMLNTGADGIYRTEEEVLQEFFKALSTGLQFTSETRLGRPLGTFDRPRPNRAEARRSGRSSQNVMVSLISLNDLAQRLAETNYDLSSRLRDQFETALDTLQALDDRTFSSVSDPQSRLKVEIVQTRINTIRDTVAQELGPVLGVAAGFNSLDGD